MAGWALAQNGERVKPELQRTDEVIRTVRPIVERSGNEKAEQMLASADEIQKQAWQLFENKLYKRAFEVTMKARQLAKEAGSLAGLNPERIRAEIEKIAERMDEIRPIIRAANEPRAIELWRMAEGELASAREQLSNQRYGLAIKFARAAMEHAKEAWEIVRGSVDPERVRAELERTDNLIERAREQLRLFPNERARQLLNKAIAWQEQARAAFDGRRFGLALKLTLSARDLILRAWENVRGRLTPELVERALAETDRLISNWSETIKSQGPIEAKELLGQAIEHQAKAQQSYESKNLKAAFAETSVARRLLNRAIELTHPEEPAPDNNNGPGDGQE